jgi:leucyl aminopeptidase
MNISAFYLTQAESPIPLELLNAQQLDEGNFSELEHNYLHAQRFKAAVGEVGIIYNQDGTLKKVMIGLGEEPEHIALAAAVSRLPQGDYAAEHLTPLAQLYWSLAQYRFGKYKKNELSPKSLLVKEKAYENVISEAEAIFLVRDLINTPANDMTPSTLSEVLASLAEKYKGEFHQWVGEELLRENYPAIHAVGRASSQAPRLLALEWGNVKHPKITLVGKGVCFDTGGLDLKPANNMRQMKKDMGGAANVIGLASLVMSKQLPVRLQVLIPAVENSIASNAYRPGDILTMRNRLTVEIDNTDAEGRLILADALVKACENQPELIIDIATLTGAARVAMGTEIAAMFCNNDQLAADITHASLQVDDPVWRMPLYKRYASQIDSSVADLSNCGATPFGGAITAALFLQRFVDPKIAWAHFDIMGWNWGSKPGKPEGGEALGILAIASYLSQRYGLLIA